jgi:hypothetical protein
MSAANSFDVLLFAAEARNLPPMGPAFLCREWASFLAGSTQRLNIQNVLLPSTRQFISDEVVSRDNGGLDLAINKSFDSVPPRLREGNTVNVL